MRVAWDLQAITGPRPTGLGVSVRCLLDALQTHSSGTQVLGLRPNELNAPLRSVPERLAWEQWRLPRRVRRESRAAALDLLYSPALGAPLRCSLPVVAHVHDLIALRFPQQFSGVAGWYWKKLLPATWRRCRALTVSNSSVADEIVELLGYPAGRIHVVPYYPDPEVAKVAQSLRESVNRPGPSHRALSYFITLASHEPRKNIELPIRALGELRRQGVEAGLLCIGLHSGHTDVLRSLAATQGVADRVEFPGYADRTTIVRRMLGCVALLFTSSYEGYGMPPQEAQSIGCPVVLSDIACHRRVYDDPQRWDSLPGSGREKPPFVATDDAAGLAGVMQRLLEDQAFRQQLAEAGLAYSATFSAAATAGALVEAYHAALA